MDSRILEIINNEKINFVLVALPEFKELIVKNEHPYITPIPDKHKAAFMESRDGVGVAVDRSLVKKYYEGNLDVRQKFILDLCDIRVIGEWNTILKT